MTDYFCFYQDFSGEKTQRARVLHKARRGMLLFI